MGHFRAPGIFNHSQVNGWKGITDVVHKKGGFFFLQLWHTGRASHSAYQPDGQRPGGPSAIAIVGETALPDESVAPYEVPRELTVEEIKSIVEDYKKAAKNSALAGFDGVEIHGANGYLIDQVSSPIYFCLSPCLSVWPSDCLNVGVSGCSSACPTVY